MQKLKHLLMLLGCFVTIIVTAQVPFTTGNIVVTRLGVGGATTLSPAFLQRIFLDEYTPAGVLVQSVPLPNVTSGANIRITMPSVYQESGALSLSPDGRYLTLIGYNKQAGSQLYPDLHTIAIVDYNAVINTTTCITDDGFPQPTNAVTSNGTDIWFNDFSNKQQPQWRR